VSSAENFFVLSGLNKVDGTRGIDGTDERRVASGCTPGGAGKSSSIFSSVVILFVSLYKSFVRNLALVGGKGNGGRLLGLPGLERNIEVLVLELIDDPDLVRLWPGEGALGNIALSPFAYGLGRCIIDPGVADLGDSEPSFVVL
jgi:hypothetical protein